MRLPAAKCFQIVSLLKRYRVDLSCDDDDDFSAAFFSLILSTLHDLIHFLASFF